MMNLKKKLLNQKKSLINNLKTFQVISDRLTSKKKKILDAKVYAENLKKVTAVQKEQKYLILLVGDGGVSKIKMN